jgi:uncharacterized membrane protein
VETIPDEEEATGSRPDPGGEIIENGEVVEGQLQDGAPVQSRVYATTRFSGPLPPPETLREYDAIVPGLAREIVDQWKGETAHRHMTIDGLRATDREAMTLFHEAERRGQRYALTAIVLVLLVVVVSLLLHSPAVGITSIVAGAAALVWALRRRSDVPGSPHTEATDLADSDTLEALPDRREAND